jgi:hypothetical protein
MRYLDRSGIVLWDGLGLDVDLQLPIKVLLNKGPQVVNTVRRKKDTIVKSCM